MLKLNVPVMGQKDTKWANQQLGTVAGTIGQYGCLLTCMSMLASYYGHNINPAEMDNWLKNNSGYVQGNLYRNDAFAREFPDCGYKDPIFCTNYTAPLDKINAELKAGRPVVVMVDFDHDPNDGIQTHFVLIVGLNDDGVYIINDPWYGDQVFFTGRYGIDQGLAINQIDLFSGPVVDATPQPQIINYKDFLTQIKGVAYGKGWPWEKVSRIKNILVQAGV